MDEFTVTPQIRSPKTRLQTGFYFKYSSARFLPTLSWRRSPLPNFARFHFYTWWIYVFIVVVVITITTRIIIVSTTWMDHSFFAVLMASESRNSTATWDPFCPHNQPTTVLPKCFVYDLGWSRAAHIRLLKRLSTKFGEVHPKLRSINFHNVTHSLISQNRRERMFVVQISLLIVTFLSPTSQNLSLLQTAKEVNPHSHIESCVNMWSVFFFFIFFFLCHMLNADACVSHITRKAKWSGPH